MSETNESVFPKMANADVLLIITTFSLMTSLVPLMSGILLNSVLLIVVAVILLVIATASFPFAIRRLSINSIRLADASKKVVHNLELEYGIKLSPSENVFIYDNVVRLTESDILGTDSNRKQVLVTLRTDATRSKVVPFVTRTL